jgi:hypothetical protein
MVCGYMQRWAKIGEVSKLAAAEFCNATMDMMERVAHAMRAAGKTPIWSTTEYRAGQWNEHTPVIAK